jgi:hypothetical protein
MYKEMLKKFKTYATIHHILVKRKDIYLLSKKIWSIVPLNISLFLNYIEYLN